MEVGAAEPGVGVVKEGVLVMGDRFVGPAIAEHELGMEVGVGVWWEEEAGSGEGEEFVVDVRTFREAVGFGAGGVFVVAVVVDQAVEFRAVAWVAGDVVGRVEEGEDFERVNGAFDAPVGVVVEFFR